MRSCSSRRAGVGDLVGDVRSLEVDIEPFADSGIDACIAAERRGELAETAAEWPRRIGARQLHRRSTGGQQLERFGRVEAQRSGEQPRDAHEHGALVDEDVDQLVDERRQPTHRDQFEVGRDLVLGQAKALGDLGERHLAAFHQPRQHDQQAPEPLLGAAVGARHQPAAWRSSHSTMSARTSAGDRTSACSIRPSTHDRNASRLAHGTRTSTSPFGERSTTRSAPSSRTTAGAANGVDSHDRLRRVTVGTEHLRVVGQHRTQVRGRPGARTDRHRPS